ncbi:MAG: septum formation initiator family protein [Actinomycetota bacterium]
MSGRRTRITPRAGILIVVLIGLLVYMAVPLKAYLAQRSRVSEIHAQTQLLERRNAALREEVRRLHDPAYVEKLARCDGMVRPGEISFVIVPADGSDPAAPSC